MISHNGNLINSIDITEKHKNDFKNNGYIEFENVFDIELIESMRSRIEPLFNGKFPNGVWPDEWNYRPQVSKPDTTREIVNIWKSDPFFARIVFSEKIGKMVSDLYGWNGARLVQDELLWKPTQASGVGFHQDAPYLDFSPNETITVWVPLNDVSCENGTLEYAVGSHKWTADSGIIDDFFGPTNYRAKMEEAAKQQGIDKADIHFVTLKKGGLSMHHGLTFHGSSKNESLTNERIAFAFHFVQADSVFSKERPGYIIGKYKTPGSNKLEEHFFPITYKNDGYKSSCIEYFTKDI